MRVLSTHIPPSSLFSKSDKTIINMYQAGGKGNRKYSCPSLQITGRSSRSRLHRETHTFSGTNPARSVPPLRLLLLFPSLRVRAERLEDCAWTRSHGKWTDKSGWNENQTRGGWQRKAISSNEQHLSPAHSQSNHPSPSRSLFTCYLSLPVTVPVIFPSLPLVFFLSLSLSLTPPLQCDCWSPKRDRGMLQESASNRCLITVLIAGHGETHAHVHSDERRQRWELLHIPHIPALLSVIISWLNYQAWIIPTCRCLEPASIYLEMRAHTTATQFSNLPFNANARFTWKLKLQAMKRRFFFPSPPFFFFFFLEGGGTCTDNWQHVETITWSPFFLTWILFAVHTRIQRAHYTISLSVSLSSRTQLHQQSTTLKRIPMRHVTGSLCPAVCLLERYRLLKYVFLHITVREEEASAASVLETCVYACMQYSYLCSIR